ncbi:uncharacterized protein PpBr36_10156 [Pyricularia pennisetigena]|uniref:uncharacterized protein n=1 Tax=Pyricularia pennisetigena TaxID=1578925 RepID=UPI0011548CE7|nr:uncharacterized protein PpBr36_10156 [Pyricularia pennisetigena]TLS21581.1 hypothetical protein PpBr36_10156 [Pyricularia pennisetigena]
MSHLGRAGRVTLQHIHLPSDAFAHTYPPYAIAAALQSRLQRALLDSKSNSSSPSPPPTILSFTPQPTYTLGRRQTVGPDLEVDGLCRPLIITHPMSKPETKHSMRPIVLRSLRGGQMTYHGPGQIVVWPILDLQPASGGYKSMGVRQYADLLQDVTADLVRNSAALGGRKLEIVKTCDPGVWVSETEQQQPRKIAAMGVHLRRHVTGLGVALNLTTPGTAANVGENEVNNESNNPWIRFVPCGLAGKGVTSVFLEAQDPNNTISLDSNPASELARLPDPGKGFAQTWAGLFASRLGLDYNPEVVNDGIPSNMKGLTAEAISIEAEMKVPLDDDGASGAAVNP